MIMIIIIIMIIIVVIIIIVVVVVVVVVVVTVMMRLPGGEAGRFTFSAAAGSDEPPLIASARPLPQACAPPRHF